ncbi:MAG: hypothetical protein LRS48_02405 [Desulfurococcales archaeon]|nr:hypothetical protein [Desulfurococcales archaeon]
MIGGHLKVLAGLLVALLLVQGVAVLAAQAQASPAGNGSNGGQGAGQQGSYQAALRIIDRVSLFINRTLTVAERYNITIPANLTANVNESLSLLAQARSTAESNATLAIQLAVRAAQTFAPVHAYVWQHVPVNVREVVERAMLEQGINVRLMIVERIKYMLMFMQNVTGTNMSDEWARIKMLENTIEQMRVELNHGNITLVKHQMQIVDHEIHQTWMDAARKNHRALLASSALIISARKTLMFTVMLKNTINNTENQLNQTGTNTSWSIARLEMLQYKTQMMAAWLNNILESITSQDNGTINSTIIQALENLDSALNQTSTLLGDAIQALSQGDTQQAVNLLSQAETVLEQAADNLSSVIGSTLPACPCAPGHHSWWEHGGHEQGPHHHNMTGANWTMIARMVEHDMAKLQRAYTKYQSGMMSKQHYKHMLEEEYEKLENILAELQQQGAPSWLIDEVQNAINWINTHQP